MIRVLFACVQNAGRSQMAAALFNALADPTKARAVSAGSAPAEHVHPEVIEVMRELGLDLAAATPTRLTDDLAAGVDLVVTMGCDEACPLVPASRRTEWDVPDPHGQPLARVRAIRDEIREHVRQLIERQRSGRTP